MAGSPIAIQPVKEIVVALAAKTQDGDVALGKKIIQRAAPAARAVDAPEYAIGRVESNEDEQPAEPRVSSLSPLHAVEPVDHLIGAAHAVVDDDVDDESSGEGGESDKPDGDIRSRRNPG